LRRRLEPRPLSRARIARCLNCTGCFTTSFTSLRNSFLAAGGTYYGKKTLSLFFFFFSLSLPLTIVLKREIMNISKIPKITFKILPKFKKFLKFL